ncbi:MAG: WecB/TagA/CpsF family glycosyltransferase [Chitinophagaceae bacterium]
MKVQRVFDVPVTLGKYNHFISSILALSEKMSGSYVCLLNVHMMIEAQKSATFKNVVENADLVTPDGKPIIWALKLLNNIEQDRVAGMDVLPDLLTELEKTNKPVFFYGGTPAMHEKTKFYLDNKHPRVRVAGFHSPPFRQLTDAENEEVAATINNSGAKVVFVILGCPKQEIWMASMKNKINAVMIGIGGALPVMVGLQKRAPKWMQNNGLEWLYRFIQEPVRLFKRYTVTNTWFLYLLFKGYFKKKQPVIKPTYKASKN